MRTHYFLAYWLLFFAVLTNIELGISVAGIPLNFQRITFLGVLAFLLVDVGSHRGRPLLLPNYLLILVLSYSLLFLLELYHSIRLHSVGEVGLQFGLTICLIFVLALLRSDSANVAPSMPWLSAIFIASIAVTIFQSADLATASQSIVLDGSFNNNMRLRSADSRNIVNTWAAGVVIAAVFLSDLCWRHARKKRRRVMLLFLAATAALVTVLSASRAALGLFIIALMLTGIREVRYGGKIGVLGALFLWGGVAFLAFEFLQDSALFLRTGDLLAGQDSSFAKRLSAFSAVVDRLDAALFVGHGGANFGAAFATENTFLGITYRYGVIGLAGYTVMWAIILARTFRNPDTKGFRNSIVITFLALLTNDLLFFPIALFVIIEALHIDSQRRFHRIGVDDRVGST